jgi:hypothetical protein
MAEFAIRDIEDNAVGDRLPIGIRGQKDELRLRIDELAN